jgi:Tol biopolymer transport system component
VLAALGVIAVLGLIAVAWVFFNSNNAPQNETNAAAVTVTTEGGQAATATQTWLGEDDDRDGLTNGQEVELNTLPDKRDTDEDGLDDGEEVLNRGTGPLKADTDGDGVKDGEEIRRGMNPLDGDSDGDGLPDANDPEPARAPTATTTPTATSQPTAATPQPTATPPPSPTPTNTPLPPATPLSTTNPVRVTVDAPNPAPAGSGPFYDFENSFAWRRGDEPNGSFQQSTAEVHNGRYAGQLSYNFPGSENDYVVFLGSRSLSGEPNQITAWVNGDGSGHYLNIWLKDSRGETWQFSFGQITHTGWQQMTAYLDPSQPWPAGHIDGPENKALDYPISFRALVLDDVPDSYAGKGTIYIDDLSSLRGTIPVTAETQPAGNRPAPSTLSGKIVYEVSRTGGTGVEAGVYWMDLKTREPQQLSGFASVPHLAPKGKKVAWKRLDGISWLDMSAARWEPVDLTFDRGDKDPNISNSGQQIAYINAAGVYVWENGISRLLVSGSEHPWWDPDDNWLAYGYNNHIYKVLITQLEPVKIATGNQPSWGPDRRIAFVKSGDIYLMDENGGNQTQLTDHPANEYHPAWSPNGARIIFVSERDGNAELYTMNPNGGDQQRLTDTPYWETSPSWGP